MSRALIGFVCLLSLGAVARRAQAVTDCTFSVQRRVMALGGDCTTDETIFVPDGFTLDGRGFTITALNAPFIINQTPAGFRGAIVQSAGDVANVRNLRIDTRDLATFCDEADTRLRGISLTGASGFVVDNVVDNVNQQGGDGCQEGFGIEAQNGGDRTTNVFIARNTIRAYQKIGIVVAGNVRATVSDNDLAGLGPVGLIAQNGIQIAFGATGVVTGNQVSGNSYTGTQPVQGKGIYVLGGPGAPTCSFVLGTATCPFTTDVRIVRNVLTENDDGVFLDNQASPGSGLAPPTRTDNRVVDNFISKRAVTNGNGFQVGVRDIGNRDRITGNVISGPGYDPAANPGAFTRRIVADPPGAVDAIVRNNRFRR